MARAAILTGDRGTGKTTLCLALAALSPRYTGLISPPLLDGSGNRIGFAVRCLASGEEWVLGRADLDLGGPRYGRFGFSSDGIARAIECLRGILLHPGTPPQTRGTAPGPVVIIDEIGPLELERGEGLAPVLPLLAAAGDLLLVVRPSLVGGVEALVPRHAPVLFTVTMENRTSLAHAIRARFA